jgi:hypothetical protein
MRNRRFSAEPYRETSIVPSYTAAATGRRKQARERTTNSAVVLRRRASALAVFLALPRPRKIEQVVDRLEFRVSHSTLKKWSADDGWVEKAARHDAPDRQPAMTTSAGAAFHAEQSGGRLREEAAKIEALHRKGYFALRLVDRAAAAALRAEVVAELIAAGKLSPAGDETTWPLTEERALAELMS